MAVKIILLIVFFAIMIAVGLYSRKHATNVSDFVLGGRSVGPWLTAFAYGTSYFSAVVFVGYAGQFGWNFGLASTWVGLGNAFIGSLMAWMLLGRRTRVMTQHIGSRTMPDFFGLRYGSKALRLVAAAIVFVFLIPYTASLFNGLAQLFSASFSLPYWGWVLIMAALTGVYVIVGGYMGSAVNNFIQGIIMLVGIVAVIAAVLHSHGGLMEAIAKLSEGSATTPAGTELKGAFTSFFGPQPLQLLGVVVLTSLGTWGLPQMVGKFYAIKDEKAITKGTVISTFFGLVVAGGCYFLGGFGRLYADSIELNAAGNPASFDAIIPAIVTGKVDFGMAGMTVTEERKAYIEKERTELVGEFCRGCGYCEPCPAGIEIPNAARMAQLIRRSPYKPYMSDTWYEKMHKIENCRHCGLCSSRCPYGLDTPALLEYMLKDYDQFYKTHKEK